MTTPPDDTQHPGGDEPVSLDKPATEPEPDFDPYRFGAPEHPVAPEYAPPGYRPPQQAPPAPQYPPQQQPPPYYPPPGSGYTASPPPPPHYGATPPPGYGYGPPGQPFYGPPAAPKTGKAVASLVLGIASIPLAILSLLDVIPVVLAVVFGIIALNQAARTPGRDGRAMAISGIVCGAVGAVLAILLTAFYIHVSNQCDQYPSGSSEFSQCVRDQF